MGKQLIPKGGNDRVMTPDHLAEKIVGHFIPFGCSVLEPCKGDGAFIRAFEKFGINPIWCEIDEGRDFFEYDGDVDWIITNPPFSQFRAFLQKSLNVADNIVFLSLANAFFFTGRLRDIRQAGFGFKEIVFVDAPPKPWPQFGIQLAFTHIQRNYTGKCKFTYEN